MFGTPLMGSFGWRTTHHPSLDFLQTVLLSLFLSLSFAGVAVCILSHLPLLPSLLSFTDSSPKKYLACRYGMNCVLPKIHMLKP